MIGRAANGVEPIALGGAPAGMPGSVALRSAARIIRCAGSAPGAWTVRLMKESMAQLEQTGSADPREIFRKYLKDHGIKNTSARRKILDAVLDLHEHFEVEQVLYLLRERGHQVGKATIYRTLPLLVNCGILKQVRFDVKQAHYEHDFGEGSHDHMVCRRCGRIVEFDADEVVELRNRIARRHHFHAIGHRFQLTGLCWECSIKCPVATMPASGE